MINVICWYSMAHLKGVFQGAIKVLLVLQEHLDGLSLQPELLINLERLLEHLVAHRNLPDGRPVKVIQPMDVVLHPGLVSL